MLTPGDPAAAIKAALMTYLGTDARVVRDVPNLFQPGDEPIVLVADDGGPMSWPVASRNIIRVTIFHQGMTPARTLARRCLGFLHTSPAGVAHVFRSGTTILEVRDSKTGADLASFTVSVTARTETLA